VNVALGLDFYYSNIAGLFDPPLPGIVWPLESCNECGDNQGGFGDFGLWCVSQ